MPDRDKYGNYINDEGVVIKVSTDKYGKDHISFYDKDVDKPHNAAHVDIDYDKGNWHSATHDADDSGTEHSSGGCYLTSACIKHFQEQFDDNCEELTILRNFRDSFVSVEDIDHYYKIAPIIVEVIDKIENNYSIYDYIYQNVVKVCVNAIKKDDYEFAYKRYKSSVIILEEQFARPVLEQRVIKVLKLTLN